MSELLLTAHTGRTTGTRSSRRLRAEGMVPGTVYGLGQDPVSVAVEWPLLRKALTTDAGVNALLTLSIEGNEQLSIVKDIQRHPTRRNVIHVDFIRLDANVEIEVEIPIILEGVALNVTQVSGMVDQSLFSLSIYSKPGDIPTEVTIDISELEVGEALHVADLVLPTGVRTEVDPEETVASALVTRSTLEAMREDEESEATEAEGGVAAAEDAEAEAEGDAGEDS
ncbi:MAG: large subunit ribosomal protein L25 [Verrucomicrobiales bacterium]|jgi:large subunit ribosomal protein L25